MFKILIKTQSKKKIMYKIKNIEDKYKGKFLKQSLITYEKDGKEMVIIFFN
jgi:hypothetical protein